MIERHCRVARLIAARPATVPGAAVLNDVKLNQIIVRFGGDEASERFDRMTADTIRRLQSEGTCFVGGAKWRGRQLMRVSVIGFETDEAQGARSADAIIAAYRSVATSG